MSSASKVLKAFMDSYAEMKPDELRMQLLDLRETVGDLEDENRRLREENAGLRVDLRRRKDMERHDTGYYVTAEDGVEEGPICPECYMSKGLVYPLETSSRGARCSVCGNLYAGAKASVQGCKQRVS